MLQQEKGKKRGEGAKGNAGSMLSLFPRLVGVRPTEEEREEKERKRRREFRWYFLFLPLFSTAPVDRTGGGKKTGGEGSHHPQ